MYIWYQSGTYEGAMWHAWNLRKVHVRRVRRQFSNCTSLYQICIVTGHGQVSVIHPHYYSRAQTHQHEPLYFRLPPYWICIYFGVHGGRSHRKLWEIRQHWFAHMWTDCTAYVGGVSDRWVVHVLPCVCLVIAVFCLITVSRLLSVALLLIVHLFWGLLGVALHLILHGVYWCIAAEVLCALNYILDMCLVTILYFISPFNVDGSISYRGVSHAIHFLGNTVSTVVWALRTPLLCAHPVLYTAIISLNAVMFVLGLLGWVLDEKYWRR